jgi:hypothetical protein
VVQEHFCATFYYISKTHELTATLMVIKELLFTDQLWTCLRKEYEDIFPLTEMKGISKLPLSDQQLSPVRGRGAKSGAVKSGMSLRNPN